MHGFAVDKMPQGQLPQKPLLFPAKLSVRIRSDIQKQTPSFGPGLGKQADQVPPGLIAFVGGLVLPGRPQCHAALPGRIRPHAGKLLLRCRNRSPGNQHLRLQVPCNIHAVLPEAYPVCAGYRLAPVKKQHIHRAEPGQKLGHLGCQQVLIALQDFLRIRSLRRPGDGQTTAAEIAEILRREVESYLDPLPAEGFRILPDQIRAIGSIFDREIRGLRIPEAEAVVVLCGQDRIPESRQPGKLRQMIEIPPPGMERFRQFLIKPGYIFLRRPHQGVTDDAAQLYVQGPVDEQPHPGIPEPFQCFRAVAAPGKRVPGKGIVRRHRLIHIWMRGCCLRAGFRIHGRYLRNENLFYFILMSFALSFYLPCLLKEYPIRKRRPCLFIYISSNIQQSGDFGKVNV